MIVDARQAHGEGPPESGSVVSAPSLCAGSPPYVDSFDGRWWILHTKPRNEKVIASALARLRIAHFLPLARCRRTYGRRSVEVRIPLFPGYVFLCGGLEDREAALKTNRVANVLEVAHQERLRSDLRHIQRVVESDEPVDLYPRLKEGCRCRVTRGSLVGLEGIVLRRRGMWRVFIGVHFLGQSAELEIDPVQLDILD